MKILHCCLANFYIDNFGYQENIITKMHKLQGHDVAILASTETYIGAELEYVKPSSYYTNEGIPIKRIPYVKWLPHFIAKKVRIYKGISEYLSRFKPDIIFLHDCQFVSITAFSEYAKNNKSVKIYVDGHTDFINSARNWTSKNILHKLIYKWCTQKIEPYTSKFYGTLPLRVEFFKDVYKTPAYKTELLPLGIDDTEINFEKRDKIRFDIREQFDIDENDFVIITGGKIDRRKNIHVLIEAINKLNIINIKLLVFGKPNLEMEEEILRLMKYSFIRNVGWIPANKSFEYFFAADIACFPGTHSVLWEEAVGLGLPCIFKRWEGITHFDLDGNCLFINSATIDEIQSAILNIYENADIFNDMRDVALNEGLKHFSYYEIAKRAIEQ